MLQIHGLSRSRLQSVVRCVGWGLQYPTTYCQSLTASFCHEPKMESSPLILQSLFHLQYGAAGAQSDPRMSISTGQTYILPTILLLIAQPASFWQWSPPSDTSRKNWVDGQLRSLSLSLGLFKRQVTEAENWKHSSCVDTQPGVSQQSDIGWETQCDSVSLLLPPSVMVQQCDSHCDSVPPNWSTFTLSSLTVMLWCCVQGSHLLVMVG